MNSYKNKKILIVEDDDLLRDLLAGIFADEGADVSKASNGAIALEMILNHSFHAVISDVRMPGGDGITLAKKIKEIKGKKPFVFICSGFSDLNTALAKQLDIIKVFEKPFDDRELVSEVLKILGD